MTRERWDSERAAAIIDGLSGLDGAALPVLHAIQDAFGYIPEDAVPLIADRLNLSRAEIRGVISFYHDFRREPAGRHIVKLCRAEACQSVGADALHTHAKRRLGIDWHETTPDGRITLEPVFCLGLCACGPAGLIDEEPVARLDHDGLDAILREARA